MYETKDLIFLQMQKAGSTHIAKVLAEIFKGSPPNQGKGKHTRASEVQIRSGKIIISSIRNPWDWYVSLWNFGCSGKGGLRHRVINAKEGGKHSVAKDWEAVYADKSNVELFRKWLHMMFAPQNRRLIGVDTEDSQSEPDYGFMTYRYIRLCWRDLCIQQTDHDEIRIERLARQDRSQCYVHDFIRIESLEDELCRVINKVRLLTTEERRLIYTIDRTNSSERVHSLRKYYDRNTIEMVLKHEDLIVSKFGYTEPR